MNLELSQLLESLKDLAKLNEANEPDLLWLHQTIYRGCMLNATLELDPHLRGLLHIYSERISQFLAHLNQVEPKDLDQLETASMPVDLSGLLAGSSKINRNLQQQNNHLASRIEELENILETQKTETP